MAQDKQKNLWQQVVQKVLPTELNIKSITEKEWDEKYKNLFRQLAEEGFPLITYDNYKSKEYYAYAYTVISSLRKMSKRKVFNMMVKARREIKEQYGAQHSLFNIVHNSFENKRKNKNNGSYLSQKIDLKSMFDASETKKNEQPRHTFRDMMRATNSRMRVGLSALAKKPFVAKPVRAVKRYGLAAMMFVTSIFSVKAMAGNDASPIANNKQQTVQTVTPRKSATPRTVQMRQVQNFSGIYNGLRIDNLHKLMPEQISMVFMSSNKANATVGGQSITTAKEFGPMLNKMSELQDFFAANSDKYPEIQKVIAKNGINSTAFEKAWLKEYSPELMHNVIKHVWAKKYQPTFDKLAEAGFPKITVENYANPENFGYSAAVISTLGQTSGKTTVDIMLKAKEKAGAKADLDKIVDASYEVKHDKWGLKTRYFGRDESKGEMAMNQEARQAVRAAQQQVRVQEAPQAETTTAPKTAPKTTSDLVFHVRNMDVLDGMQEEVALGHSQSSVRESTALPKADTLYMHEINQDSLIVNGEDSVTQRNLAEKFAEAQADSAESQHQPVIDFDENLMSASDWAKAKELLQSYDIDFSDTISLETGRVQLEEEKAKLEGELATIGSGVYKGMKLDFSELYPENAGHVYESLLNPTIKDSKSIYTTEAMGLYQFNMNNTMKLLANALADEFPDLKAAKDAHKGGCRNADYERAWVKYSTGSKKAQFERRQFDFMFDKFYQKVFDNLTERCGAPVITKENYNLPEYWAYTASTMSLINQNPARSPGMIEKAIVAAIESEAKTAAEKKEVATIKYLLYEPKLTKEERKLGRVHLKHYVTGNQPNWATVAAASYDVRARQWSKLKSRYLGSVRKGKKIENGEKDLVAKVDRFLREAPTMEARLSQVNTALQAVELAQTKVASPLIFWATAQNLKECEAVQVDAAKVAKIDQLVALERRAGNMKELKQTRKRIQRTLSVTGNSGEQDQASVNTQRTGRRGGNQKQAQGNNEQYV